MYIQSTGASVLPELSLSISHTHTHVTNLQISCSREVFPILVKGDRHDAISGVECFFHSVAMVNINVNVQHSLVVPVIRNMYNVRTEEGRVSESISERENCFTGSSKLVEVQVREGGIQRV